MDVRAYLPSAKFAVLVGAIAFSVGLVFAAEWAVRPHTQTAQLQNVGGDVVQNADWQGAFASSTAFQDASALASQAAQLTQAVQTSNLTDSIGRTLLINTTAAAGQGLGTDQPTRNQIVSEVLSQMQSAPASPNAFSSADLTVIPDSAASLHAYGNTLASIIAAHSIATPLTTMAAVGMGVDYQSSSALAKLNEVAADYRALAQEVIGTPVPVSLASDALQIADNDMQMADACSAMELILSDPLKGIAGVQAYNTLNDQDMQVFTQIANIFQKDVILFTKSEAGSAWSEAAITYQTAQAQAAAQAITQTGSTP